MGIDDGRGEPPDSLDVCPRNPGISPLDCVFTVVMYNNTRELLPGVRAVPGSGLSHVRAADAIRAAPAVTRSIRDSGDDGA
jgi:hypothetical protein